MDEALLRQLTDDDPEQRLKAVLQAGEPGEGPAPAALVEGLIRRLHDPHPGIIQAALETLTRLVEAGRATVGAEPLARAVALAEHDSALVRAEAIGALGVFGPQLDDPPRVARLLAALEDPDPEVRRTAAAACGDLKLESARERLALALDDADLGFEAAFALASLGDRRARPALERALDDRRTRLDALEGLARLGDPAARPAVEALTRGWRTAWVDRLSAWSTLLVLGVPEAGARIAERTSSRRMEERTYALFLLGRHRVQEGRDVVAAVAASRTDRQRETAIDALGRYGDEAAETALLALIDSPREDREARITAVRALAYVEGERARSTRLRLGRDPDPLIQQAAAWSPPS